MGIHFSCKMNKFLIAVLFNILMHDIVKAFENYLIKTEEHNNYLIETGDNDDGRNEVSSGPVIHSRLPRKRKTTVNAHKNMTDRIKKITQKPKTLPGHVHFDEQQLLPLIDEGTQIVKNTDENTDIKSLTTDSSNGKAMQLPQENTISFK